MSEMPTIVKILGYLRDSKTARDYPDIISNVGEGQEYLDKALEKLVSGGIIANEGGSYHYEATPRTEEFCQKMFALYEKVIKKPHLELLIRGLLCQFPSRYLVHLSTLHKVLEREGISKEQINAFLQQEIGAGHVKKIKLIYVGKASLPFPLYIPSYYFSYLRNIASIEYEKVEEYCQSSGLLFHEEDYLLGDYPSELANPAREYLQREKQQMLDALKEQALGQWISLRLSWWGY